MPPKKKPLRGPILPSALDAKVVATLDGLDLNQCRLEGCALSNDRADHVRFDGVHIVGAALNETKIEHLGWLDVLCERCDLSMIDWPGAKMMRVEVRGCRTTGAKLTGCDLDNVRFFDCQLDYASFAAARFRQVSFEQCRLKEADFSGADLSGTSFVDCQLQGVDFTRAKLLGADVSTSSLGEIRVGAGDVRGLVVNREQATVLAQLFGLVLRDD